MIETPSTRRFRIVMEDAGITPIKTPCFEHYHEEAPASGLLGAILAIRTVISLSLNWELKSSSD